MSIKLCLTVTIKTKILKICFYNVLKTELWLFKGTVSVKITFTVPLITFKTLTYSCLSENLFHLLYNCLDHWYKVCNLLFYQEFENSYFKVKLVLYWINIWPPHRSRNQVGICCAFLTKVQAVGQVRIQNDPGPPW